MTKTKRKTKTTPKQQGIDPIKLSQAVFKVFSTILLIIYKILNGLLINYKHYKRTKDFKTYIRLREEYINIACSDQQYKDDMTVIDMANFKPKTIVEMRDKALERYINSQVKLSDIK